MKQGKNKYTGPLCAGYLVLALVTSAAEQSLMTPPPSEFVDAESSVNVPIPTDEGRHLKLTLAFDSTPSRCLWGLTPWMPVPVDAEGQGGGAMVTVSLRPYHKGLTLPLPEQSKRVYRVVVLEQRPLKEVAAEFGITYVAAKQIKSRLDRAVESILCRYRTTAG